MSFDEASVHPELDFFYGGSNKNFFQACNFLSPNIREFIAFFISDIEQNMMKNNSLSIHIDSQNIFYQNSNTNENFYSFLLAQQAEKKVTISKCFCYHYSFENIPKKIYRPFE